MIVDTRIPIGTTSRPYDPRDPMGTTAPATEVQHAAASRGISMESALRQQADILARQAEEQSGATAEARTWLRSRSTTRALLDLTTIVLNLQKEALKNNG
jgi:hypothetical protein